MARRERITKTLVDSLSLGEHEPEFVVWDSDVPRFAVRVRHGVRRGGGAYVLKVYVLQLRASGRQRWITIGKHGEWTPEKAREEANRVIGQAVHVEQLRKTGQAPATLRHPVEARDHGRAAPTLTEFAKRYIEDYAKPHKPASLKGDQGNLRRAILPVLGRLRLDAITRSDVVRFHLGRKDTPTNANRCLALLSHMFNMAEQWGLRSDGSNPCRHVDRFPEPERERFLSTGELVRLGKALIALEKAAGTKVRGSLPKVTPYGLAAVRLLLFIGARASEVLGLTWTLVDAKTDVVRLARSKAGARTLFLNAPARAVIATIPRVKNNPYVIVGGKRGTRLTLSGLEQVWQEVRKVAKLEDVHLHDLRHSFGSVAVGGGATLPILGALLGHKQAQTTKRYAHLAADPLKAAAKTVGQNIATAMKGRTRVPRTAKRARR